MPAIRVNFRNKKTPGVRKTNGEKKKKKAKSYPKTKKKNAKSTKV